MLEDKLAGVSGWAVGGGGSSTRRLSVGGVGEADVLELDLAAQGGGSALGVLVEVALVEHELEDAARAGEAEGDLGVGKARGVGGEVEHAQQAEVGDDAAGVEQALAEE